MKFFKLSLITFIVAAFFTACNLDRQNTVSRHPSDAAEAVARENLDLQAIGGLLEKADDAEEFEYLLNSENGVDNLDLNGDGYADYISVREFDDRDDNQRGFSLYSMFGPDMIQEIAQVIFYRDRYDHPGSRVLLIGNEQIYGDNYYYETDWLDRSVPISTWVFTDRDNYYRSPYYYGYYPDYYEAYEVVETPAYENRIREYYYQPVFVRTPEPVYITQIKIKSPNKDRSIDKIYAKLAKPNKEQLEFKKNNPHKPVFVPVKNGDMKRADFHPQGNPDREKGNPNRMEMPKGHPDRIEKPGKINNERPVRQEKQHPNKPEKSVNEGPVMRGNPNKIERRPQQPAMKQQKPQGNPNAKQNNPGGNKGGNKGGGKGGGKKG